MENFETEIDKIFGDINNWLKISQLVLNCNKTHYLQFNTKNSMDYDLKLNCQGNYVKSLSNTKFFSLIVDDSVSWKAHVDHMMYKLNTACFCNLNDTSYNVSNFKNGLLSIHTFNCKLWNNFLGESAI